jgi:NSS family neurotransmitter:Na+ symporter
MVREDNDSRHGMWSSRLSFVLAATGSAVGLGNIWRFPYVTAESGGGAFVLIYLFCVIVVGLPIMLAEIIMGRRGRQSPINTLRLLTKESHASGWWTLIGWSGMLVGFMILSFYSVIAGWTLSYTTTYVEVIVTGAEGIGDPQAIFGNLLSNPWKLLGWHSLFMALTAAIVAMGVEKGLERSVRILMPLLFTLLLVLVGYGMTTGYFDEALVYLFKPDFSRITPAVLLDAMGQAFFSLSLGMAAIMAYGAYLPRSIPAGSTALTIGLADSGVALVAGLAIFPIAIANGLTTGGGGVGFTFTTLPYAFNSMSFGQFFGLAFFGLLAVAAWTSAISLMEPPVAYLVERTRLKRFQAAIVVAIAVWLLGIGTVLSFNAWSDYKLFDRNFQENMEFIASNVLLPLGGLAIAIFAGWVLSKADTRDELHEMKAATYGVWRFLVRYVSPILVFLVFLSAIGVLNLNSESDLAMPAETESAATEETLMEDSAE